MKTDSLLWPRVKAGHYAIPDMHGVLRFYKIDAPMEGKWAGWLFVKTQASDDLYPIKDAAHRERVFREISKDPVAALQRYGREIGRCGHCGRTLTDETSRQLGIGPVCRGEVGL